MIQNHFDRVLGKWQRVIEWRPSPSILDSRDLDIAIVKFTEWPPMGEPMKRGKNFVGFWMSIRCSYGMGWGLVTIEISLKHRVYRYVLIPRIEIRWY